MIFAFLFLQLVVSTQALPATIAANLNNPLDFKSNALDFKINEMSKEMMQVLDALYADDAVPVQIDGASEAYLTQKLMEGGPITHNSALVGQGGGD